MSAVTVSVSQEVLDYFKHEPGGHTCTIDTDALKNHLAMGGMGWQVGVAKLAAASSRSSTPNIVDEFQSHYLEGTSTETGQILKSLGNDKTY